MKDLETVGDPIALFGGEASPVIAQLLRDAAASYQQTSRAEAILWSAQAIDPTCLPVYFALYKFYFYKYRLTDAEKVALMGLETAARQGGFPARLVTPVPSVSGLEFDGGNAAFLPVHPQSAGLHSPALGKTGGKPRLRLGRKFSDS